jgi:hypothetical protein
MVGGIVSYCMAGLSFLSRLLPYHIEESGSALRYVAAIHRALSPRSNLPETPRALPLPRPACLAPPRRHREPFQHLVLAGVGQQVAFCVVLVLRVGED